METLNPKINHAIELIKDYQKTGDGLTLLGLSQQTGLTLTQINLIIQENQIKPHPIEATFSLKSAQSPLPISAETVIFFADPAPIPDKPRHRCLPPIDPHLPPNPITIYPRFTLIYPFGNDEK